MSLPAAAVELPTAEQLADELETWRRRGVLRLGSVQLPALGRAALAVGLATSSSDAAQPAVLKELVRTAISPIAGSVSGRCALVLLGLDPNTFDLAPHLLREDAAEIYGVRVERFRREPQRQVLLVVANAVLDVATAHRARLTRQAMEQRHPAETRLAVQWLERFEAYFRIWTPVYGLGADLAAYRSTLLEPDRQWDREGGDAVEYTQEMQAAGYATSALFHLACVLDTERRFIVRFGGLWLLSSPEAEAEARDALHAVVHQTDANERDQSWLRVALDDARREMHPFLSRLQEDRIGKAAHQDWRQWLNQCGCAWEEASHDPTVEYFATGRYHPGIRPACPVHQVIEAANRYCTIIEHEWLKVADWYSYPLQHP